MAKTALPFQSEAALVKALLGKLRSGKTPWGKVKTATEFDYQRGRTDVVAVSSCGAVVSFEAKLTKWKAAMHQAFRNTSFSHESFIVVPESVVARAIAHLEEFDRRNVGICFLKQGVLVVAHHARSVDPIQPWLTTKARHAVAQSKA
jgi:hypothetical protein